MSQLKRSGFGVMLLVFATPYALACGYAVSPLTPLEIAEFLKLPDTRVLDEDPIEWKWSTERLRIGRPVPGGCQYDESGSFSQLPKETTRLLSVEVAVNPKTCQALVIEGEPAASSLHRIMEFFASARL